MNISANRSYNPPCCECGEFGYRVVVNVVNNNNNDNGLFHFLYMKSLFLVLFVATCNIIIRIRNHDTRKTRTAVRYHVPVHLGG